MEGFLRVFFLKIKKKKVDFSFNGDVKYYITIFLDLFESFDFRIKSFFFFEFFFILFARHLD